MKADSEKEQRLKALDHAIERGLADIEAGRVKPAAEVFQRLEEKYQQAGKAKTQN